MHLRDGSVGEFAREASSGALTAKLVGAFYGRHGCAPSEAEAKSWTNSLAAAVDAFGDTIPEDAWFICEYHLARSGERIDLVVLGAGEDGALTLW